MSHDLIARHVPSKHKTLNDLMLVQRRRRWVNIKTISDQRLHDCGLHASDHVVLMEISC